MNGAHHEVSVSVKKPWFKRKLLIIVGITALVLPLLFLALVSQWYSSQLLPRGGEQDIVFTIEQGQASGAIGRNLEEQGIIKNQRAFSWYVGREGVRNKLQAGSYLLSPSMSTQEIVEKLANGETSRKKVRIPAGFRLAQIEELLTEAGFEQTDVAEAMAKFRDHKALQFAPNTADLEGYLLPDTYLGGLTAPVEDFLQLSLNEFEKLWTDQRLAAIDEQGLTPHEAVILASIVQKEADDPDIQKQVAQVFLKRLREGIPLGADPTFLYAAAILGVKPSTTLDSPYNTRVYKGLPPGPISNFNPSALEAVANPADGDFLYFVAGDDGTVYFTKTLAEHQEKTRKYCIENCKL